MRNSSPPRDSIIPALEQHEYDHTDDKKWSTKALIRHAERSHSRMPGIRKVPLRSIAVILLVALVNVVVWIGVAIVLAIDLMTRRLLATGQKPVTVGTFFSLGHSTIVIVTSIVVAATAAAVSSRFDRFSTIGGIIGTSVSAAFLILLGIMNAYILYKLYKQMQKVLDLPEGQEDEAWKIEGGGFLFGVLKKMFKLVDRPWKMYPLGVLFGLGFDTSSEIALLGISSIEAAKGTSFWVILIFPILFTAGMCLLDTTDGALMLALYIQPATNFLPSKSPTSTSIAPSESPLIDPPTPTSEAPLDPPVRNHRDPVAFLYYSIVLTTLTVIVAIIIGVIQLLTLILNVAEPTGRFWDGVQTAGDYYDVIGGGICGAFLVFGTLSVFVYKPWRRWVGKRHGQLSTSGDEEGRYRDEVEGGENIARVDTPLNEGGSSPRVSYGAVEVPKGAADSAGFSLSTCPPVFVLPAHLSLDELHQAEETLLQHGAKLTYDVGEAALILGRVGQKKRAALELRSRGVWTEEVPSPSSSSPPVKRRKLERDGSVVATEDVYLSTEDESEGGGVRERKRPAAQLKHPQLSTPAVSGDRLLDGAGEGVIRVAKLEWLIRCVEEQELAPIEPFVIYHAQKIEKPPTKSDKDNANAQAILDRAKQDAAFKVPLPPVNRNRYHHDTASTASQRPPPTLYRTTTSENDEAEPLPPPPDWVKNHVLYSCMRSTPLLPPNEAFINQLIKIRTIRELNLDSIGVRAYSTAIASLAAYPHEIRRASQILTLPGCDHKIANLFSEFRASDKGTLSAAEALDTDTDLVTLHQFYNIWGVGAKTARDFYYARQWRDLDDIVEHGWASLSRVQQIGLKYYDEFLLDIPRAEVESISRTICKHANSVRENSSYDGRGVECIVVGSYRRGKPVSHDVDIILTHRDEAMTHNLIVDVVASLEAEGWITHTLALHLTTSNRGQQPLPYRGETEGENHFDSLDKALVVWQDPNPPSSSSSTEPDTSNAGNKENTNPHRRVDIIISPWRTVGCAVLGWSGDTTFERDLRRWAKKSRGWKFDSSGVRERTTGGQVIDLETGGETWEVRERMVMEGLGVGFREAGERCTR
ncbi:high-affinity nickel-transport protein-domain-containing protein [Aspergillus karnatakaensis]|uniref:high-affinity nickel-transport protein-domain-containing protein n=1 Tax=Aspergillus karnatakaensis TaxID=1810916 RepID=UPI003CCDF0DA